MGQKLQGILDDLENIQAGSKDLETAIKNASLKQEQELDQIKEGLKEYLFPYFAYFEPTHSNSFRWHELIFLDKSDNSKKMKIGYITQNDKDYFLFRPFELDDSNGYIGVVEFDRKTSEVNFYWVDTNKERGTNPSIIFFPLENNKSTDSKLSPLIPVFKYDKMSSRELGKVTHMDESHYDNFVMYLGQALVASSSILAHMENNILGRLSE